LRKGFALLWSFKFSYLALFLAAGCGAWFYYNTHILNEFRTEREDRHRQADYERLYKKYERLPQPKVTAVDVAVDMK